MPFGDKVPPGGGFLPESYLIRGQKYLLGRPCGISSRKLMRFGDKVPPPGWVSPGKIPYFSVSTHSLMLSGVAPLRSFPSFQFIAGYAALKSFTAPSISLLPEVANNTTVFPEKSYVSRKELSHSPSSSWNICSSGFPKYRAIFRDRRVEGTYLPASMELIVCRETPTASASSCWVISLMARSMRSVFFISGSSSICALKG